MCIRDSIGNDSGLMHLAAASGTPTMGLFGPTDASEYGPAGPCAISVIGSDETMAGISIEAAEKAAVRLLALRKSGQN